MDVQRLRRGQPVDGDDDGGKSAQEACVALPAVIVEGAVVAEVDERCYKSAPLPAHGKRLHAHDRGVRTITACEQQKRQHYWRRRARIEI